MAFNQVYTASTANQLITDMAAFISANNWVVDLNTTYNTYNRIHFHQGSAHFEFYAISDTSWVVYGCSGYSSGSIPSAQPGAAGGNGGAIVAGARYTFISSVGMISMGRESSIGGSWYWTFFWNNLNVKVGSWSGGFGFITDSTNGGFTTVAYNAPGFAKINYNGVWSTGSAAGGLVSNGSETQLPGDQPFTFNGGLLPLPMILYLENSNSQYQPLGFVNGLYSVNGGNIYMPFDPITIGANNYIIMPKSSYVIGSSGNDFLFQLGA